MNTIMRVPCGETVPDHARAKTPPEASDVLRAAPGKQPAGQ
jgi:hypothetical protein